MQTLLQLLSREYAQAMTKANAHKAAHELPIDVDGYVAATQDFLRFAEAYLRENRPATLGHVEDTYVIKLTNMAECVLCQPADGAAAMQAANAAPITGGFTAAEIADAQQEMEAFWDGVANRDPQPPVGVDLTQPQPAKNLTTQQPQRDLTKPS